MENEPKVELTTTPKVIDQFGKRQYLSPKQSRKKTTIAILVVICSFFSFLGQGRRSIRKDVKGIALPTMTGVSIIDIPDYSLNDEITKKPASLKRKTRSNFSGPLVISRPFSEQIPPGSIVKAILISGASDGLVKAKTIEPLLFAGNTVLPAQTTLVGSGKSEKHRLKVNFTQAILPSGQIERINAEALDQTDKTIGLKGSKIGHYSLKLAATAGLNFAAGLSQGLREKEPMGNSVVEKTDLKNAALNGTSLAALELARESMNQAKLDRPKYFIPPNTFFFTVFTSN